MTELVVARNWWLILGVFLANALGYVLSAYCLTRVTDRHRSLWQRVLLAALGAWSLVGSGYDNTVFVAATALQTEGVEVRYALLPSIYTIVGLTIVVTLILTFVSYRSGLAWVVVGGALMGLVVAVACVAAMNSIRADRVTSVDFRGSVVIVAGFAVVAAVALGLTMRASHRVPLASAIVLIGAGLTVTEYLITGHVRVSAITNTGFGSAQGVRPIGAIIVALLAFVARILALTVVSLTDPTGSVRKKPFRPRF